MICRIWHGWTSQSNADAYAHLMWFDSLEAVRAFAGADYEVAVVPPAARVRPDRFDARSAHFEVRLPQGAV